MFPYYIGVPESLYTTCIVAKLAIYYMHVLYPSLWLPVPGLSSQFFAIISYATYLLLRSAMISNIFGKWVQDFVSFGNPCVHVHVQCILI